jgi:predicted nucleic acid-binding protein
LIGWLVDTNVIASLIAPGGAPWARAVDEHRLYLSVLTLAEYDKGIAISQTTTPTLIASSQLETRSRIRFAGRILSLGDSAVRRWGAISGRVKRETGHPPPVIDSLLAATAIEADLYLVSRNTKDLEHSGAAVFDPWRDDIGAFPLRPPRRR